MIPKRLLPQQVTYTPYLGEGPEGPVYGDPMTVPARIQFGSALVRDAQGDALVVSASTVVYLQPSDTPPAVGTMFTMPDGSQREAKAIHHTVGARDVELLTVEVS
ncbi:hypothetical protein [Tsukamurella tyrosinosolvens]|uniref:hypothetical protein n=1 Tax=Tsukamurella tyrosinosolvens TaxID=57704 RepID=UPI003F4A105F